MSWFSWFSSKPTTTTARANARKVISDYGPCRFKLDLSTSAKFLLPDGRELGYAEYGAKSGRPVIYMHGLPGSRLEAEGMSQVASQAGLRIIAVDRPGYGWSSPHPGRTLLDHATDIGQLTEHLGLEEWAVMGISGGGPYALACAKTHPPKKLKAAMIICGLGPPQAPNTGMNFMNWLGFGAGGWRYLPWLCKPFFGRQVGGRLDLSDEERLEWLVEDRLKLLAKKNNGVHPKEAELMKDIDRARLYLAASRQTFGQGYEEGKGFDGMSQDGNLLASDFGFKIEDIRKDVPVLLWYGEHDTFVPPAHGRYIEERLGNAKMNMEDHTHWIGAVRPEMMESLAKAMG